MRLREKVLYPYPTAIEMATQEVHPDPEVAAKKLQDKKFDVNVQLLLTDLKKQDYARNIQDYCRT